MRIVYDVSPLSHPLTGVGNYIRGSLAGIVEAAGGKHELVAFAPTSPAGRHAIPRALDGLDVELQLVPLPFSQRWRDAWSRLRRPALERFLGDFDVLHYSDWMYPPQAGGVRATTVHDLVPLRFPEWVTPKTASMHGAKYANTARTADLVFVNSEFTGRDVVDRLGIAPERIRVAYPGVRDAFRPDGDRADLGRPYVLTVATLEPRKNLQTLVAAHRLLGEGVLLAVAGGSGWGDQPELRGADVVRLGFVSDDELARLYRGAAAVVYPSRFEGFGMPITEAMACGAPTVASSHESMDEASGAAAVRADPEDPEALAAAIRTALERRDELARPGSSMRAGSRGVPRASRSWPAMRRHRGDSRRRRRLAARADARRDGAPRPRTSRRAGGERGDRDLATVVRRLRQGVVGRTRHVVVLLPGCRARHGGSICSIARPSAGRCGRHCRSSSRLHDLALVRHPELFPRWHRHTGRAAIGPVARAADRVFAVSEFTAREAVELLGVPEERVIVIGNAIEPVFTPDGPAAEGDYVLAVATLEPRKNLRRISEAAERIGAELRVVGARGWGGVDTPGWVGEVSDAELAALYRGASALVFPSLYEGFGIPVLEAMASGAPVVTSRGGATEEVAGGAAVLVDPLDVAGIATGIEEASSRRDELRTLGLERARTYSWVAVADAVERVWRELA